MTRGPDGAAAPRDRPIGRGRPEDSAPSQPTRPVGVQFASTVLIVGGVFRLAAIGLTLSAPAESAVAVEPAIVLVELVIQVATVVIGGLVLFGRAWILAVNVVAVLAFLQLLSLAGVVSLSLGILYSVAFVGIFLAKPWFDAMRDWRAAESARAAARRRA